jgi:hypothetical protein
MFAAPVIVVCLSILGCITSTRSLLENPEDSNMNRRVTHFRLRNFSRVQRLMSALRSGCRVSGGRCGVTGSGCGMAATRTARGMTAATGRTSASARSASTFTAATAVAISNVYQRKSSNCCHQDQALQKRICVLHKNLPPPFTILIPSFGSNSRGACACRSRGPLAHTTCEKSENRLLRIYAWS